MRIINNIYLRYRIFRRTCRRIEMRSRRTISVNIAVYNCCTPCRFRIGSLFGIMSTIKLLMAIFRLAYSPFIFNYKNNTIVLLTAHVLGSPRDVNAAETALLGVRGYCGAKTFAIASLVASASVEDTSFDVVVHGNLRVTGFEH